MGARIAKGIAGAALPQRKETGWAVSCAEIPHAFHPYLPK